MILRTSRICLFVALLFVGAVHARASDLIAPERGRVMTLIIGGKHSTYYHLAADTASYLTVTGPARLTFIVRLAPALPSADTLAYSMVVSSGGQILETVSTTTGPIDWHWLNSDRGVCKSRKFSVSIPEGTHRLKVELKNTDVPDAGVRYMLSSGSPHGSETTLYPTGMAEAVTVLLKEKPLDYFIATAEKPVEVRVVGPTRLRAVTRLVYSGTMKGPQRFGLDVREDGKPVPSEALITKKSLAANFPDHPEWSIGESRTVYFPIAAGEHDLTLRLTGTDAPGLAVRFTIPKEDIENGLE